MPRGVTGENVPNQKFSTPLRCAIIAKSLLSGKSLRFSFLKINNRQNHCPVSIIKKICVCAGVRAFAADGKAPPVAIIVKNAKAADSLLKLNMILVPA